MNRKNIKSRCEELEVPEQNPFENDKLNREPLCDILTDIVSYYGQSGCVMSLNGEWGAGKTTFVRMWRQYLTNKGFKTLYFNAWTSDYSGDALIPIIAELKDIAPNSPLIDKIVTVGSRIGLTVLKAAARRLLGADNKDFEDISSVLVEIGRESILKFEQQKKTIDEFKKLIIRFVDDNAGEHPVVFFIDELDRCNPHYAVSVLEKVKHLFDIPNIIFVMAMNKTQLGNAIHGYFGSESIDSDEYLRRFIDIDYTLPRPKIEGYCKYLYAQYGFGEFFEDPTRVKQFSEYNEKEEFIGMTCRLCSGYDSNLRQIDRVFSYARLALMQFGNLTYMAPGVYFMLCFWKVLKPKFYDKIKCLKYSMQELVDDLEVNMPVEELRIINTYGNRELISAIACLIFSYDVTITLDRLSQSPFLKFHKVNGKRVSDLTMKYIDKGILDELLDYYYTRAPQRNTRGLKNIFDRIDLLVGLQ